MIRTVDLARGKIRTCVVAHVIERPAAQLVKRFLVLANFIEGQSTG
jgi:hypothetical protein